MSRTKRCPVRPADDMAGTATRLGAAIDTTVVLARRLLWNRPLDGRPRQQPVVVLLGPVGSGKSTALTKISRDYGGGVVHAGFDFKPDEPVTTVAVLAHLAFRLSRKWPPRRPARFLRFTLGLIAVLTPLDTLNRENARNQLQAEIDRVFPRKRGIDKWVQAATSAGVQAGVLTPVLAQAIDLALPLLVRAIEGRHLRRAANWHKDMPEAENAASAWDALVTLNLQARTHPEEMTAWLADAFLADVRESHLRMSAPDLRSSCSCDVPKGAHHLHNWVLLLDDLHFSGGYDFVADLVAARERYTLQHPHDHDPLVVIASSGRWNAEEWESGWLPPWRSPDGPQERAQVVPRCRNAEYDHWAQLVGADRRPHPYYPVLLEPLYPAETTGIVVPGSEMAGTDEERIRCALVQRATGGLPARVYALAEQLRGRTLQPGSRNALHPAVLGAGSETWSSRVADLRLTEHLPNLGVDDVISAAPFATAPWLVHADAANLAAQPQVGQILTELRTALWVVAPDQGGGTPDPAELQPWIARTLLAALAERPAAEGKPTYEDQFEALLSDPATQADPARTAYCRLALGRFAAVVGHFEATFQDLPHRRWIERLELVTSAPDPVPLDRTCDQIYEELVDEDVGVTGTDRDDVRNIVTRLIAARWLVANPFTTPAFTLRDTIATSYGDLRGKSHRSDMAPLTTAAARARKMF